MGYETHYIPEREFKDKIIEDHILWAYLRGKNDEIKSHFNAFEVSFVERILNILFFWKSVKFHHKIISKQPITHVPLLDLHLDCSSIFSVCQTSLLPSVFWCIALTALGLCLDYSIMSSAGPHNVAAPSCAQNVLRMLLDCCNISSTCQARIVISKLCSRFSWPMLGLLIHVQCRSNIVQPFLEKNFSFVLSRDIVLSPWTFLHTSWLIMPPRNTKNNLNL